MNVLNPRNTKQLEQATLKLLMDGQTTKIALVATELRISEAQAAKVVRGLWRKALIKPYFHDQKAFAKFNSDQVLKNCVWSSQKLRSSVKRAPLPQYSLPSLKLSAQSFFKNRGGNPPGSGQQKSKSKDLSKLGKGEEGRKQPVIEKGRAGSALGGQTRGPQSTPQATKSSR